ncbi:glycosyltransferase family 4 protein [Myxococcota bacterium]|nr:glycosyltransferase family 4 protein [Myxococcota bacterium]
MQAGHDVTVITGVPNVPTGVVYEGYRNRLYQRHVVADIETLRVWTYIAANKGTVRRIANYLSYMISAVVAGLFVRRPDVVIATSPQFFCGWAGVWLSRFRRVPLVLEIRDIWPESITAVGAMKSRTLLIRYLEWLEGRMYAAATRIVTVGEGYRDELLERGVPAHNIDVVPNGVDRRMFVDEGGGPALREKYGLGDNFVCSFVGTIGMASGLGVALRAARLLRDAGRDDVTLVLVGDGAVREELESQAREEGLTHVVFTGRQDRETMPDHLAMSDACLVHLERIELFKTVLPSKIFEAAAMGRPIVLGVEGRAAQIVEQAEAGICIEPENEQQLLDAVLRLASDPEMARRLGQNGMERIASVYDYDRLAGEYARVISDVASQGTTAS